MCFAHNSAQKSEKSEGMGIWAAGPETDDGTENPDPDQTKTCKADGSICSGCSRSFDHHIEHAAPPTSNQALGHCKKSDIRFAQRQGYLNCVLRQVIIVTPV